VEVEELEPTNPELSATMQAMKDRGIGMVYGRWLIEGAPRVLLFDTKSAYQWMNEWKGDLWNVFAIPSPSDDEESSEAVVFGYLVAWFLGEVITPCLAGRSIRCANSLSLYATRRRRQLLRTSTSGFPVLRSR